MQSLNYSFALLIERNKLTTDVILLYFSTAERKINELTSEPEEQNKP